MELTQSDLKTLSKSRDRYRKLTSKQVVSDTKSETVEEFIARGGVKQEIPQGATAITWKTFVTPNKATRFKQSQKKGAHKNSQVWKDNGGKKK